MITTESTEGNAAGLGWHSSGMGMGWDVGPVAQSFRSSAPHWLRTPTAFRQWAQGWGEERGPTLGKPSREIQPQGGWNRLRAPNPGYPRELGDPGPWPESRWDTA